MELFRYIDFESNMDKEVIEISRITEEDIDDKGVLRIPSEIDGVEVRAVGTGAAENLQGVEKIIFSAGISKIENWSFKGCSAKTIVIPSSVCKIGALAFSGCHSLSHVKVLDSTNRFVRLGNEAFKNCENLKNVEITPKVIPVSCFEGCSKLDYEINNFVTEIAAKAFSGTKISKFKLNSKDAPIQLKYIGADAFAYCKHLANVFIPNETRVCDGAFNGCSSLTFVSIGKGCELGEVIFTDCKKLLSVKWPTDITTVPYGTFCDCKILCKIDSAAKITKVEAYAFANTSVNANDFLELRISNTGESAFTGSKNKRKAYSTV